jgi:hypothetical protein
VRPFESPFLAWLAAFAFTQLVEVPIYAPAFRTKRVLKAFGASAITHPVVWWVIPRLWPDAWGGYWGTVVVAETFAVVVEAAYLVVLGVRPRWAVPWSLAANGASCGLGFFVYWCLGWM